MEASLLMQNGQKLEIWSLRFFSFTFTPDLFAFPYIGNHSAFSAHRYHEGCGQQAVNVDNLDSHKHNYRGMYSIAGY